MLILTNEAKPEGHDTIKTKKLDAPQFSGNIRDYPSFKINYERHMYPVYGDDPYALRSCLTGNAAWSVKGVEDDYIKMFERLNVKYGCPQKLVDAILGELKILKKVPEGDTNKLIQMIEVVERAWLDLERMKMSEEMNTTLMISFVEKLLPDLQRREWAIYKQNQNSKLGNARFSEMVNFLIREKTAIEYMSDGVRCGNSGGNNNIHQVHTAQTNIQEDTSNLVKEIADIHSSMKLVVDGLAQVSQAMHNSRYTNRPSHFENTGRSGERNDHSTKKYCWLHDIDGHDIRDCSLFK